MFFASRENHLLEYFKGEMKSARADHYVLCLLGALVIISKGKSEHITRWSYWIGQFAKKNELWTQDLI